MERITDRLYRMLMAIYRRYANRFLPRWYVFAFDVFAVFVSFFAAKAIRLNLQWYNLKFEEVAIMATFSTLIYTLFFFIYRSYIGVIRHTGFSELARVLKATGAAFGVLMALCFIRDRLGIHILFLGRYAVFVIHFLLAFFLLTGSRVIIRHIFSSLTKSNISKKRRVIIFGAGSAGLVTRGALMQDLHINYQIIAFVDDNPSKIGKVLDGTPVLSAAQAFNHNFVAKNQADMLIVAVQAIGVDRRREIIETSIELQLEVKVMPPVRDWINGRLSASQLRHARIEELLEREPIKLSIGHVKKALEGKVVLITGAAGSIGSGLARQIIAYNPKLVVMLDQAETALYDLQFELNHLPHLKPFEHLARFEVANIRDQHRMESVFKTYKPDLVYHAAAYKHVPLMEENPYEAVCVNVVGTRNVADLAVKYGVEKFVMVSTDKAVNPTNVMGASKRIAEIYVQSLSGTPTQFVTTRFGNVLDSNGSVIPLFRKQIEQGGPITITHPEITRYFMLIPEACSLVLEAGTMGNNNEIFVFDMGKPVKIKDLARRMIQLAGLAPEKDIQIKEIGLRPGEKLYEELLTNGENTLSTHHPKIMRARVTVYNHSVVLNHLKELEKALETNDNFEIVAKIKEIVPEYISNNSAFGVLDEKRSPAES